MAMNLAYISMFFIIAQTFFFANDDRRRDVDKPTFASDFLKSQSR